MKLTDTHRRDVFPIAMLRENIKLNIQTALRFDPSICLGLIVLVVVFKYIM